MPKIVCTFGTGEVVGYDLSDELTSNGSVALPLREQDYFNLVFLESGTPTWPNGMCVCPDEIFLHGSRIHNGSLLSSASNEPENLAIRVWFEVDFICVELTDGRQVKTPLAFYPRLANATPAQRENFQMSGRGFGIHWPEIDEDLTVQGIALGRKATM